MTLRRYLLPPLNKVYEGRGESNIPSPPLESMFWSHKWHFPDFLFLGSVEGRGGCKPSWAIMASASGLSGLDWSYSISETNLASHWEGARLPRASGKSPDFPGSSPNLPGSFSATSPEVLSLWNLTAIQGLPGSFPDFSGSSPDFPGSFLDFPGGQPLSLGSLTPSPDSQKLSLKILVRSWRHKEVLGSCVPQFGTTKGKPSLRWCCGNDGPNDIIFTNPSSFWQLTRTMVWVLPPRKLGPWSEFPSLYSFTVLLNSGGSNPPWSEFWYEFLHLWGWGWFPHRQNMVTSETSENKKMQPGSTCAKLAGHHHITSHYRLSRFMAENGI